MEQLLLAASLIGNGLWKFASFLAVISVVVVIHELGHFWVARWCGVKVAQFSFGFSKNEIGIGRELYGWNDKHGTRWSIQSMPLGGFVRFIDDQNAASKPDLKSLDELPAEMRPGMFYFKSLKEKAAIIFAGPLANFILTVFVYTGIFWLAGEPVASARVKEVLPESPAYAAGFVAGDVIVSIDGRRIDSFTAVQKIVSTSTGRELEVGVDRGGVLVKLKATPRSAQADDGIGGKVRMGRLGISGPNTPTDWSQKQYGLVDAVGRSFSEMWFVTTQTLSYLGRIVTLQESPDQLGGPARIAEMSGKVTSAGFVSYLAFIAFISLSIGLANLLPIPVLDGGHLTMYALEAIRGRKLSERATDLAFRFGFAVLITMFVVANFNDIGIFKRWLGL